MSRREVLVATSRALGLLALVGEGGCRGIAPGDGGEPPALDTLVAEVRVYRLVAADYLSHAPHENRVEVLMGRLFPAGEAPLALADLRRDLSSSMRADFRDGHTFLTGGWLLSRTEGRLCSLATQLAT